MTSAAATSLDLAVDELRSAEKLVLCTHEHPDGDALGSLLAMTRALELTGRDAKAFMAPDEFPLPYEYGFLELHNLVTELPEDLEDRVVVFLDCGNIDRNPAETLRRATRIVNIDHHHDNTRFGTVNHVDPTASSTAEMVWAMLKPLGAPLTLEIAEALYVGLVTDTGKFMYENTGPSAHVMAASLLEAGIDAQAIYRRLFEGVPQGKLILLARGLSHIERFDGGLLTLTQLSMDDYSAAGAEEAYSEGVVDHLRSLEGTAVAGLVRDVFGKNGTRKVSLRAADDRVDVSRIARAQGGGGHRRAAGFNTSLQWDELVEFLRGAVREQLPATA